MAHVRGVARKVAEAAAAIKKVGDAFMVDTEAEEEAYEAPLEPEESIQEDDSPAKSTEADETTAPPLMDVDDWWLRVTQSEEDDDTVDDEIEHPNLRKKKKTKLKPVGHH